MNRHENNNQSERNDMNNLQKDDIYKKGQKICPICRNANAIYERSLNNIDLLKCKNCNFVYANLDDNYIFSVNSSYDENTTTQYTIKQSHADIIWFENVAHKLTKKFGKGRVLDVGCGNGLLLRQFIKKGWEAFGLDISPWAREPAKLYGYKLYNSELEKSSLPDNYFDLVISMSTLEHIAHPCEHVKAMLKVLKPMGILYVAGVPNYNSLSQKFSISKFRSNKPPGHVNYFTENTISNLFSSNNFMEIKKLKVNTYGIPELHSLYGFFLNLFKNNRTLRFTKKSSSGKVQNAILRLIVNIYYYLGRPFGLGDKIELFVLKK